MEFNVIGIDDVTTSPLERFTCATNDGTNIYVGSESVSGQGHVWKYSPDYGWSKITENLIDSTAKSISAIKYKNSKLFVGTQGTFTNYGTGQVWVHKGINNGWKQLTFYGTGVVNIGIRSIEFLNNDLYTAGSYYLVWKYVNGALDLPYSPSYWSEPYGALSSTIWNDLVSDGQNIYGAITAFTVSSNVIKYNGASWDTIATNGFGDRYNVGTSKLCLHNNQLIAATFNDKTGTEVWKYDGASWSQINVDGFGASSNYTTVSLESIDGSLLASVEGIGGGEIWKYNEAGTSWTKQTLSTDVIYKSYIIQRVGSINYLVGKVKKNFIADTSIVDWITLAERVDASANYFPDGSVACFPVENNKYRFIAANSLWTLVTEGPLSDPLETVISPAQYSKGLDNYDPSKFGITKGTDITDKKADFSGFNPSITSDPVYLPNVRYLSAGVVYKIPDTSTIILWAHGEEGYWNSASLSAQFDGTYFNSFVRQLVSFDNGNTIYDCGTILHSAYKARPNTAVSGNGMGLGGYAIRDGYFYFFYNFDTIAPTQPDNTATRLSVMRASYQDVIDSALNKTTCDWYKYYNGSFSESSLTGTSTDLLTYITGVGWCVAYYSTILNKYVFFTTASTNTIDYNSFYVFPEINATDFDEECYVMLSEDGINWGFPEKVSKFGTSCVYTTPISFDGYKGELSEEFRVLGQPALWTSPNTISKYHTVTTQQVRDVDRSFSISKYTQPFKIPKAMDRGQLHPVVATIHHIGEQAKLLEASAYYHYNPSSYVLDNSWRNVLQSYANSSTELSGDFPNSFDDYVDFRFGRDFHKFYEEYTHSFNAHRTSPMVTKQNGPVILAHALGSLLYNSDFDKRGSLTTAYPSLVTTNLANTVEFRSKDGVFSSSGTTSGTYIASSILNVGEREYEFRNSGILDHIELCQVSGSSRNNNFVILDIDPSFKSSTRRNSLLDDNILIKQSAFDGFGRIIFDISKYSFDSNLYDVTSNFLSPDHEFNVKFKSVISDSEGLSFGGGTVAVWIHTKPEMNKIWSYTKEGQWVQHSASAITVQDVLSNSHLFNLPRIERDLSQKFKCIKFLDKNNPNRKNDVIASITESDFTEVSINFNTRNHACIGTEKTIVPQEYFEGVSNHVHRLDQDYVIEVFTVPTQDDKFTLYYDLSMIDLTLNKMSKPLITGIPNGSNMGDIYCQEFRVDLDKQQILNIIKYFNQIRGEYSKPGYTGINNLTGYASRSATTTSGFYEVSGGSRLNYTESPLWNTTSINASSLIESITIIN